MEIDVSDYVSESEIRNAILDQVRTSTMFHLKDEKDIQRIITNESYELVYKLVDEYFDNKLAETISKKVENIIDNMSTYNIFKEPNAWDREPNTAYKHLQKCIESQFPKIEKIVSDEIETETIQALKRDLKEYIIEAVQNLFTKEQ